MSDSESFEERYSKLQHQYIERTKARLERLETLSRELGSSDPEERFDEILQIVHRLAGSGETLGFAEVSDCSAETEEWLKGVSEPAQALETIRHRIVKYVREVRQALDE
jgi:HPt (histidine-containing phosphotransfer) domain-containing protein